MSRADNHGPALRPPSRAPTPLAREHHVILAGSEMAECLRDHQLALLLPKAEYRVSKLAGVAAGLRRAAERILQNLEDGTADGAAVQAPPLEQKESTDDHQLEGKREGAGQEDRREGESLRDEEEGRSGGKEEGLSG